MIDFVLDGNSITSPLEWQGIEFKASFEKTVQADISITELTFGFDACKLIDNWVGSYGYFRGMPLTVVEDGFTIFEGHLDFQERFEVIHKGKYLVSIKKTKGLNYLSDMIDGYSLSLLNENRPLTIHEMKYVVNKLDYGLEDAILALTLFMLAKEAIEIIKKIQELAKDLTLAIAGTPLSLERWIGLALQIIINIAMASLIVIQFVRLMTQLISLFLPITRKHKCLNVKEVLTVFSLDSGFSGFDTGIKELGEIYYVPARVQEKSLSINDKNNDGLPHANDFGYTMKQLTTLIGDTFNAKFYIDNNNVVQLRSENDVYLQRNSTYVLPDVLNENVTYNTKDMIGTRFISFEQDITDEWTIEDFEGVSYEIFTKSISSKGENLIKGLDKVSLPVCLGSRRSKLTTFENGLLGLAKGADNLVNKLGGSSNLANRVRGNVGMMRVSKTTWSQPKLLRLDSNLKLPANRNNWGAKYLYDNYHSYKSFVLNGNGYQRREVRDLEIPFNLNDLKALINNSYFTDLSGNLGKFVNVEYNIDGNKAKVSYWVENVYDTNLIETYKASK